MSEFDISKYNANDLYELLGVEPSISDRELEAKILGMINQYKNAKVTSNGRDNEYDQVINFMIEIYTFFFDNNTDDVDVIGPNSSGPDGKGDDRGRNINLQKKPYDKRNDVDNVIISESPGNRQQAIDGPTEKPDRKDNREDTSRSKFTFSYPLQYAQDSDGNIINQSTKRVVSINSGSRYNANGTISSSFTLNLTETLKNVVKLKLYSVSIPYSWYTISEDFGSNFFYFKGDSPGINNETHDIRIQIEPGNYSGTTLVSTLNDAIAHLSGKSDDDVYNSIHNPYIPDVSLNNTTIRYTQSSGKTKMFIGIIKNYDSNYFRVRFPYTTPVYTNPLTRERNNTLSIPSFLGITNDTLNSYTVLSDLSGGVPSVTIDASNNTIKLLRYIQSESNAFNGTNVLKTIDLSFDIGTDDNITETLNSKLTNHNDIDINSKYIIDGSGNYLKIKLNRDDSINNLNTKVIVLFPFNTDNTNIWTDDLQFNTDDTTSYLGINYKYKILNDVVSREPIVDDRIIVPQSRTIKLEFVPTKPLYNGISSDGTVLTSDISLNKFEIVIPTNDSGYTVDEFIKELNDGFDNTNVLFTDNHNTSIFNKPSVKTNIIKLDNTNNLQITVDISYNLGASNYILELSNTIFGNVFDISSNNTDLSLNSGIAQYDNIQKQNSYNIKAIMDTGVEYLLVLKPKQYGQLRNLPNINIKPEFIDTSGTVIDFSNETNITIDVLTDYIIKAITTYTNNSYNVPNLLSNSGFIITDSTSSGRINLELSLNISDYLDETNYKLELTDSSNIIWNNKFHISGSYDLSDNNNISSSKAIDKDVITVNAINNKIIIEPLPTNVDGGSNGVFDVLNRNTMYINIPFGNYTRNELISKINDLLKTVTIASGKILSSRMSFNVRTVDNTEYCLIDFNLNRTFKAEDFKVVFFDSTFANCSIGSTSIQNTTFDSTVGYILGYRNKTEFPLRNVLYSSLPDVKQFVSTQQLNVNLYNEFSIVLDDYNNNRLPSAIVSGEQPSTDFELPTYAKRAASSCDENGNLILSVTDKNNNNLTAKQLSAIYSNIVTSQAKQTDIFTSNRKIIAKDVFAVIPLNVAGLDAGQLFVKEGITLQEQSRSYFGPVDIQRITVKLLTDKGSLVNLNQDNWSFSFVCEQIHDNDLNISKIPGGMLNNYNTYIIYIYYSLYTNNR